MQLKTIAKRIKYAKGKALLQRKTGNINNGPSCTSTKKKYKAF